MQFSQLIKLKITTCFGTGKPSASTRKPVAEVGKSNIMQHIFYIFAAFAILYEGIVLMNPVKFLRFKEKVRITPNELKSDIAKSWGWCLLFYFLWCFAGLFSSQFPLFLGIFLCNLIPKKFVLTVMIDASLSFFLLLFIIINKYHLHIDITDYIISNMFK